MTLRRRDFQTAVNFLQEFQLKLTEGQDSSELRDSLNMCLLHLQKYYKMLKTRTDEQLRDSVNLSSSLSRGLSPITPFRDAPDRFQWKWVNLENPSIAATLTRSLTSSTEDFSNIPHILQATKVGDIQTVNRILNQDGLESVLNVDGLGRNCVMYAVHYRQDELLNFFISHKLVDVNFRAHDESTAVHRACHDNNWTALKALVEGGGANCGLADVEGRTPLHWAATLNDNDTQCLHILLNCGVDLTPRDNVGMTPAMWAVRMDCVGAFQLLARVGRGQSTPLDVGLDLDQQGWGVLQWAVRRTEPLNCLHSLLTRDSCQIEDFQGRNLVHVAAEQGASAAVKLVLEVCGESGEVVNKQDSKGRTPLHLASMTGHGNVVNLLCERGADLHIQDDNKATAWDYATGSQLHYCKLILQYYRQKSTNQNGASAGDVISARQSTDMKPPFLSPRPPPFPQSRSSTPITPRSRQMTSRASTKRSSMAASINGSISPPPDEDYRSGGGGGGDGAGDEDRGMSTYRSSAANSSFHGPLFPQKKVKPNSPRDDLTNENRLLRSGLGVEQVDSSRVPQMSHSGDRGASSDTEGETKIEQEQHPELETSGSMGGPQGLQGAGGGDVRLESRTQNVLIINNDEEDIDENDDKENQMNGETNSFQYSNGVRTEEEQNTYEVERPTSPAGSDVTDVSFPMNVSDVDTDPPTVIHRPIKSNVESNRSAELHNEQQQIMQQPTKKITLDMDQNLLGSPMKSQGGDVRKTHAFGKKPKRDQNSMSPIAPIQNNFNPPLGKPARTSSTSMPSSMQRSSLNRSPISGQISPQQQQQPQQPMRNLQSAHVTPQQQPIRSLQSGHVTNSRMSPQNASQALSPDNSLSISSNSRTGIHSGMKPKPAKRVQSQSPAKIQNEAKSEEFAMEKEKQLADIKFTPLHRRPSPGGHLEPLQHKLPSSLPTHTLFADDSGTPKRGRKKTKRGAGGGTSGGARVGVDGGVLSSAGVTSHSMPRSGGRLEPLEASVQGSSYPIYNSAKKRAPPVPVQQQGGGGDQSRKSPNSQNHPEKQQQHQQHPDDLPAQPVPLVRKSQSAVITMPHRGGGGGGPVARRNPGSKHTQNAAD